MFILTTAEGIFLPFIWQPLRIQDLERKPEVLLRKGFTPAKTLITSARAAHIARRGSDFGIDTGEIKIIFDKMMAVWERNFQKFTPSDRISHCIHPYTTTWYNRNEILSEPIKQRGL